MGFLMLKDPDGQYFMVVMVWRCWLICRVGCTLNMVLNVIWYFMNDKYTNTCFYWSFLWSNYDTNTPGSSINLFPPKIKSWDRIAHIVLQFVVHNVITSIQFAFIKITTLQIINWLWREFPPWWMVIQEPKFQDWPHCLVLPTWHDIKVMLFKAPKIKLQRWCVFIRTLQNTIWWMSASFPWSTPGTDSVA
jgi:hypothetical protein